MMDGSVVIGLYIDRHLNGIRTRGVGDLAQTKTFAEKWKNDQKIYKIKLAVTKDTITGYLNEKQQFKPVRENNLSDGRIGLAVWNGDVNFDDLKVYGPEGLHVEPIDKLACSWARIKQPRRSN